MRKLSHIALLLTLISLLGCTTPVTAPTTPKEGPKITTTQPTVTKDTTPSLDKVDWSKYSEYTLFSFYLILLLAACIYFKKTGKHLPEIEAPLTAMSPKLSVRTKVLSLLAKVVGLIYCKKK